MKRMLMLVLSIFVLLMVHPAGAAEKDAVQQMLETTYLGHAANLPDPDEPALVLEKYLSTDNHAIVENVAEWEQLVKDFPTSRHASLGLAKAYERAGLLGNALGSYRKASMIALGHGLIRYTREISELCVTLSDKEQLDEVFKQLLSTDRDRKGYYLALVDYADGLAKLGDYKNAFPVFDRAVKEYRERNIEAINRYCKHLEKQGKWDKVLEVVDTLTENQRVWEVFPAYHRREALLNLGLDTSSADAEIAKVKLNLSGLKRSPFGAVIIEDGTENFSGTENSLLAPAAAAAGGKRINGVCGSANGRTFPYAPSSNLCSAGTPTAVEGTGPWTWQCIGVNGGSSASCSAKIGGWSHANAEDDCRTAYFNSSACTCTSSSSLFGPGRVIWTMYPAGTNAAEIIYNEARSESKGAQDMVGWVITDRAHQTVSCDAYVGGYPATSCIGGLSCAPMPNCSPSNCLVDGPYSTPNEHCWTADQCNAGCNANQQICCVAHGGTTEGGRRQVQFNDSHVSCETLCTSGALFEAAYTLHGMVPDISNPTWVPAGHTSCTVDCVRPACEPLGLMSWGTSPNGPMEYLAYNYCAAHTGRKQCKWFSGNVCGDKALSTTCCEDCAPDGDNHFWNRNQTRP